METDHKVKLSVQLLPSIELIKVAASIEPFPPGNQTNATHLNLPFQMQTPTANKDKVGNLLAGTFFNIFNYKHGSLNTHRDRCLMTLVWGWHETDDHDQAADNGPVSKLWVQKLQHKEKHELRDETHLREGEWLDMHAHVARQSSRGIQSDNASGSCRGVSFGVAVFVGMI
jgi:hypothetical protein